MALSIHILCFLFLLLPFLAPSLAFWSDYANEREENSIELTAEARNNGSRNVLGFGFVPLTDGTDENTARICIELEGFQCLTNDQQDLKVATCIESYLTCDSVPTCIDGSDEWCDNGLEACQCFPDEFCNKADHLCYSLNGTIYQPVQRTRAKGSIALYDIDVDDEDLNDEEQMPVDSLFENSSIRLANVNSSYFCLLGSSMLLTFSMFL